MTMLKKFLKSRFGIALITRFYHAYMVFCFRTSRVEWINRAALQAVDKPGQKLLIAFWHGRMALMPFWSSRRGETFVMISRHGDGERITQAMARFGLRAVRGSTNRASADVKGFKDRGGSQVLREGLRVLKAGNAVAVTPDGPRGPRMYAQPGILLLAQVSGAPIIPLTFSTSRARVIKSWDRFLLPYPFGKIVMVAGAPLHVPCGADETALEEIRLKLENRLNAITREADTRAGIAPMEPEEKDDG